MKNQQQIHPIQVQDTPNPDSIQFIFPKKITARVFEFKDQQSASSSPLARTLLGFPWVKQVFISDNFLTLTKENWVEWESLKPALLDLIADYWNKAEPVITAGQNAGSIDHHQDSEIIQKIKDIIDKDIQPAVRMDGGFIQFSDYKQGRLYLRLQGACSGCPSAEWTLKQGIEARIRQDIPQVKEVISV